MDDNEDLEIRLQPTDPDVDRAREQMRSSNEVTFNIDPEQSETPPEPAQYSLKQMMIVTTAVAVVMALLQAFAPSMVAGLLGLAMLVTGGIILLTTPENPVFVRGWIVVFVMYVAASVFAVIRS